MGAKGSKGGKGAKATGTPKTTSTGTAPSAEATAAAKHGLTLTQYNEHYQGWLALAQNGRIAKSAFVNMMITAGGCDKEMAEVLFDTYDADGSGDVDVDEFLGLCALSLNGSELDKIRASFNAFDKDKDGVLTKDELRTKLRTFVRTSKFGNAITAEESAQIDTEVNKVLDEIFDLIDTDKSGTIDREEYVTGFGSNQEVLKFIQSIKE